MALPNLADLKPHLNMVASVGDDELQEFLDAAIEVVEGIVGSLEPAPVTEVHHGVSSGILVLRRSPATALVSMSVRSGPMSTPLTLSDYELDVDTGIVRAFTGSGFYGNYVVNYTAGFDTLPASVRLATLIIAAHLHETQRMPGLSADSRPTGFGGADGIADTADVVGRGFAIPSRAEELLRPYMNPVIA